MSFFYKPINGYYSTFAPTNNIKEMKKFFITLMVMCFTISHAQTLEQFKALNDSVFQTNQKYTNGNKYQKDVMLFVDMLADTHPYYIKKERRDSLMAKQDALLAECGKCQSDSDFVKILVNTIGRLHDKHTDVIDLTRLAELKAKKAAEMAKEAESEKGDHIMSRKDDLFHYEIVAEHSLCYLQFNQCVDARTMRNEALPRWDMMLDEMFGKIDSLGIKTLVVDAQYNNGGSSMLCDELLIHLKAYADMKQFSSFIRFSNFMGTFNPRIAIAKKSWEGDGHIDELYPMPQGKPDASFVQPKVYEGKVVFVQSAKTYSSAGMLMTMARDNNIGTIIGATSTYSPSHYGEILPYRLPNTNIVGTISSKYFVRPDKTVEEDATLEPDVKLDLTDKDAAWKYIIDNYCKK